MLLTYDIEAGLWVLAPGSRFAPAKPRLTGATNGFGGVVRPANCETCTSEVVLRSIS